MKQNWKLSALSISSKSGSKKNEAYAEKNTMLTVKHGGAQ